MNTGKRYRQTAVHNFVLPTACHDDQTAVFSSAPNLLLYLQVKIKYNFYQRLIPHLIINKNIISKTTPTNHIKRNTLLYLELLEHGTSQYSCGNPKRYSFNSCFNSMTILHINPSSTMHTVP